MLSPCVLVVQTAASLYSDRRRARAADVGRHEVTELFYDSHLHRPHKHPESLTNPRRSREDPGCVLSRVLALWAGDETSLRSDTEIEQVEAVPDPRRRLAADQINDDATQHPGVAKLPDGRAECCSHLVKPGFPTLKHPTAGVMKTGLKTTGKEADRRV